MELNDILVGYHNTDTYDVGFTLTENKELKLQIAVEWQPIMSKKERVVRKSATQNKR